MSINHLQLSSHSGFSADATITDDGRVDIAIDETDPTKLAALLANTPVTPSPPPASTAAAEAAQSPPRLNIVIQVVGSRGDVQPFVALGHVLRRKYGHRVRLVTHAVFREFVQAPDEVDQGRIEFFDIGGGDPAELMSFMVKNGGGNRSSVDDGGSGGDGDDDADDDDDGAPGGLIPPMEAYSNGEIAQRRRFIEAVLNGCWRSMADEATDATEAALSGTGSSFVADAIIANPPSFANVHIAECLGVPLHIMFTMPWTPTRSFPHPLANLKCISSAAAASSSAASPSQSLYGFASYLSYTLVECLTWQGLGDIINRFRVRSLGLEPLSPLLAVAPFHQGGLMGRLRVPTTYCWSPALLPKPADWGPEITVAGYFFSEQKSGNMSKVKTQAKTEVKVPKDIAAYTPSKELAAFLAAGPPPVYIGFGSIVVDDPAGLTHTLVDAVGRLDGARAIISKGWAGLGGDGDGDNSLKTDTLRDKNNIFFLAHDCPHEWLFPRMACVVHHGGAGTTAAGLRFGLPTVVVPFFGDQPFWGSLVAGAGAGPQPIPSSQMTAERLAAAIQHALLPATKQQAATLGAKICAELGSGGGGTAVGARSFHEHLDLPRLGCALLPGRLAVWTCSLSSKTTIQLSALAAAILVQEGKIGYKDLKLFRAQEYNLCEIDQPWEPISGAGSAILGDLTSIAMAVADFPRELFARQKQDGAGEVKEPAQQEGDGETTSVQVDTPSATITLDTALLAGKSVGRIVSTGLHSPLHFCTGLARGFHNAPRLYHDDTVRPLPGAVAADGTPAADAITDLGSGIRAASKAFGYGLYDGVTGLVTQPLRGAAGDKDKGGGGGLVKGFAKGIGGVILKPAAGAWAVPAYTMQGVQAEVQRIMDGITQSTSGRKKMEAQRVAARVQQGAAELAGSSDSERQAVVGHWEEVARTG